MLLKLMLSACQECGHEEDYTQKLVATHYRDNMYILSFTCPVCHYKNEVVASDKDIKELFIR